MVLEKIRTLEKMRENIDAADEQLAQLLVQRLKISREIAGYKRQNNIPILDQKRELEMIKDRTKKFKEQGLNDEKFVAELFELIMRKSREVQQ